MELKGEEVIAQPIQRVWDCLNDPEILKACLSGCEEITKIGDNDYKVVLTAAVGPVKARFNGKLMLSNLNPPTSYSLTFEGAGGAAGFAKGGAHVHLSPAGTATKLVYEANAKIGGKIAQVGSRLIDGVARRIAADFFARFNELIAPPQSTEPEPIVAREPVPRSPPVVIWVAAGIAAILALYFYLS